MKWEGKPLMRFCFLGTKKACLTGQVTWQTIVIHHKPNGLLTQLDWLTLIFLVSQRCCTKMFQCECENIHLPTYLPIHPPTRKYFSTYESGCVSAACLHVESGRWKPSEMESTKVLTPSFNLQRFQLFLRIKTKIRLSSLAFCLLCNVMRTFFSHT